MTKASFAPHEPYHGMILLDEQVRSDQRVLLTRFGIAFRQIGKDTATSGIKDENIVPFLSIR
jgi:hypothetical protein